MWVTFVVSTSFPSKRFFLLSLTHSASIPPIHFVLKLLIKTKKHQSHKIYATLTFLDMEHKFVKFWVIDRDGDFMCFFLFVFSRFRERKLWRKGFKAGSKLWAIYEWEIIVIKCASGLMKRRVKQQHSREETLSSCYRYKFWEKGSKPYPSERLSKRPTTSTTSVNKANIHWNLITPCWSLWAGFEPMNWDSEKTLCGKFPSNNASNFLSRPKRFHSKNNK